MKYLIKCWFISSILWVELCFASTELVTVKESYLDDVAGTLQLKEVQLEPFASRFKEPGARGLSFGWVDHPMWFRLDIESVNSEQPLYLLVTWPLIDDLKVYFVDTAGNLIESYHVGDQKPFGERPIFDTHFVFSAPLREKNIARIYFRVETSSSMQMPYEFISESDYFRSRSYRSLGQGIFFGLMMGIIFYTLFLYISTKRSAYLHYIFFVICFTAVQAGLKSTGFQFIWPNIPAFNNYAIASMGSLALIFLNTFARSFLQLDPKHLLSKVNQGFIYLGGVFFIASLILPYIQVIAPLAIAIILSAITVIGIAVYRYHQGFHEARFYLLAWFAMVIGSVTYLLKQLGLLPMNFYTENSMQVGSVLEVLLLSFALADRLNTLRTRLELNNQNLEQEVEQRTKELKDALAELEAANQVLAEISATDKLTGLKNRHYFDAALAKEINRASRGQGDLSLALLDIDHFKKINDTHGHIVGDRVIQHVAIALKQVIRREIDVVSRYGGEEFAIILPATEHSSAALVAERVRVKIANSALSEGEMAVAVTVSIGIATLPSGESSRNEAFVRAADIALYNAKQDGRNCIHCFSGDVLSNSENKQTLSHKYQPKDE